MFPGANPMILACCRSRRAMAMFCVPKDGENAKPDAPTSPEARIRAACRNLASRGSDSGTSTLEASAGTCNLLFSQGLHDKLISAEIPQTPAAIGERPRIFSFGESC